MHVIVIDQSHDDPTNTLGAMMWPIMGAQKKKAVPSGIAWQLGKGWRLLSSTSQRHDFSMALIEIDGLPSGYVKIAIENEHL